jgi:oligopeptide/dipeptide ABC transporter ATP-binding protein
MDSNELLVLNHLHVDFHLRNGVLKAVSDVNLALSSGKTVGIVGESGSGKSVMSKAINRLNPVPPARTSGDVILDGVNVLTLSSDEMRKVRGQKVSMIFQEPMTSLNPVFTIGSQMAAGLMTHLKIKKIEAYRRSADFLANVGIPSPKERLKQYPHELSGGMRQRVMIAMALSCHPTLLIADEPTTALDVTIQAQILDLLAATIESSGMSLILISHDLSVVADVCERICVMYAGRQVEIGSTREVFRKPVHPYTIGLKESQPQFDAASEYLKPIAGMVPNMLKVPPGCAFHPRCSSVEDVCRSKIPELREIGSGHRIACHVV